MKTKLIALMLLAGSAAFAQTNFYFGIGINTGPRAVMVAPPPPPPPPVRMVPRSPGRGYVWVPGYWALAGNRYGWQDGYWTRPPRGKGKWVAPRYAQNRYYPGYWR